MSTEKTTTPKMTFAKFKDQPVTEHLTGSSNEQLECRTGFISGSLPLAR